MKHGMAAKTSRRVWLSRLLTAVVVAPVLEVTSVGDVSAKKKGTKYRDTVKNRIRTQRDLCEIVGHGTLTVTKSPFGPGRNTRTGGQSYDTKCNGGDHDGTSCHHTRNNTTCKCTKTGQSGYCNPSITVPPQSGGRQMSGDIGSHQPNHTAQPSDEPE